MKKIILGALVVLIIYSLLFWRNSQKFEITPEGGIIEEKREIMPNDSIDSLNRGRIVLQKTEYYLVSGDKKNEAMDKKIDEFTCKAIDKDFEKYYQYNIIFYRQSRRLNERKIKGDYNKFSEYVNDQQDFICWFIWFEGSFGGKEIKVSESEFRTEMHLKCN